MKRAAASKDASGHPLTRPVSLWASNTGVAPESGIGLVSGVGAPSATISATSGGGSETAAPSAGPWPNAPAGWTVVTDYDAHALNSGGWVNAYATSITSGQVSVVHDPTGPLNPTVWQFYYRQGDQRLCGAGPGTEYYNLPATKHLYLGEWVKFSNPFSFPTVNGSDPELHTLYVFAQSGKGQLVLDMQANGDIRLVSEFGAGTNFYSMASPHWTLGAWHRVEMLLDAAGAATVWMDGVLSINATGIPYPADAGFNEVQVTGTWGGCIPPNAPAFDSWVWVNHIDIRTP
jgi:hypothetical protein